MIKTLLCIAAFITLMSAALAIDGVEMRPGEEGFEYLFYQGIGEPWVGGNPPWQQDQNLNTRATFSAGSSTSANLELQFSQYYSLITDSASKTHIKAPKKHDISSKAPVTLYFGYQMQAVPYSQYQSYASFAGDCSLWIEGSTSWTQFAAAPLGASLSLLGATGTGGNGYLYEIAPSGKLQKNSYYFFPGYNQIGFYADSPGQHILLFVIGNQVSNAVIIEVIGQPSTYQPVGSIGGYPPVGTVSPGIPTSSAPGDTSVSIVSQGMRGYQVFLDGTYIGTEGTAGDPMDGRFNFKVAGNQYHDIRVYDGQFNYPKNIYFQKGVQKIIYVEPGTAAYI